MLKKNLEQVLRARYKGEASFFKLMIDLVTKQIFQSFPEIFGFLQYLQK